MYASSPTYGQPYYQSGFDFVDGYVCLFFSLTLIEFSSACGKKRETEAESVFLSRWKQNV